MSATICEIRPHASTDSSHSSHSSHFSNLSPAQAQVVEAFVTGATVSGAARQAGVHRTTIHHWIRSNAEFKAAAQSAQSEYTEALSDEMRELSATALKTLRNLLDSADVPPGVRLRAALAILQRPHFPHPGWHLPERIEPPRKQQLADTLTEIKADYDVLRMSEAPQAKSPTGEPDRGQSGPAASAPIARSSPCPCGSGQKYKRCCGAASRGQACRNVT